MCAPSVLTAALGEVTRREVLHYVAGVWSGLSLSTSRSPATPFDSLDGGSGKPSPPRPVRRTIPADHLLDLTHTLSPTFPIWPGNAPISLSNKSQFHRDGFYANRWDVGEHHGTHLDAPAHCSAAGVTAEKIAPATLVAPLAVIDIRPRVKKDVDTAVQVDDLRGWEKRYGRLPAGSVVALCSGWDSRVHDAQAFLGRDSSGTLHFPGFSPGAAEFLLQEREVAGLIVDTLSIDIGPSRDFPVHKLWLGAGKWAVECAARLDQVPPDGATVFVGAPKVAGASGGPVRLLALW
jgi:kynurenine formamidase